MPATTRERQVIPLLTVEVAPSARPVSEAEARRRWATVGQVLMEIAFTLLDTPEGRATLEAAGVELGSTGALYLGPAEE